MARFTVSDVVVDGITRLDKDIADAKGRVAQAQEQLDAAQSLLARLQAMRDNVLPFLTEYVSGEARAAREESSSEGGSFVDEVVEVFHQHSGTDLDVDQVSKILQENGSHQNRERVRNSVNYALRLGKIHRGSRRGVYTLEDTSTPAATGVEVSEEPSDWLPREIGDSL